MTRQRFTPAYPAELRERGVRLIRENRGAYASDMAADKAIARELGCSPDSLRVWCQQAERDSGQRAGLTSAEKDRIRDLERLCCTNGVRDSLLGSSGVATAHERLLPCDVQDPELAFGQHGAEAARFAIDPV